MEHSQCGAKRILEAMTKDLDPELNALPSQEREEVLKHAELYGEDWSWIQAEGVDGANEATFVVAKLAALDIKGHRLSDSQLETLANALAEMSGTTAAPIYDLVHSSDPRVRNVVNGTRWPEYTRRAEE